MKPALTLQQFRAACAIVDSGFNVSRAATRLNTTQSAVSKSIRTLEDDLSAPIFARNSLRMTGLTDYGHDFIELARRILRDTDLAVARARDDSSGTHGTFRIATTHVHARHTLPAVIRAFRARYPDVRVEIEQGDGSDVVRWVAARDVQVGISVLPATLPSGLVTLPAMDLERCLVVPHGHHLLSIEKPTLHDLARYRLVCYTADHPSGRRIRAMFERSGLTADIATSATDASVIKEFVAAGEGVAILHRIAMLPEDLARFALIDISHVLPATQTCLIARAGDHLRDYVYDFMEGFAPSWRARSIRRAIARDDGEVDAPPRAANAGMLVEKAASA